MNSQKPRRGTRHWVVTAFAALTGIAAWVAAPLALVSSNSAAIVIPTTIGNAAPYSSDVSVSGMTGTVKSVRVTLHNFTHGAIDDVAVVLVGPGGQALLLMDGVADPTGSVSDVTLTFSDAAAGVLSNVAAPVTGVWKPTAYYTGDSFPAPGPLTVYSHPGPAGGNAATLNGTFGGTNPNGTWRLFVRDFVDGEGGSIAGGWSLDVSTVLPASKPFDFDGDGRADASVIRFSGGVGTWYVQRSSDGAMQSSVWGAATDAPTPSDYDGDGKADVAVWRPTAPSKFFVLNSTNGAAAITNWGLAGDDPRLAGDYDGDGRSDHVIRRPGASPAAQSTYYVRRSSDGAMQVVPWGLTADFASPGDFDGDGRFDFAVQRDLGSNVGAFFIQQSTAGFLAVQWGLATDVIAPGDYDGDGKYDIAVARSQSGARVWYVRQSSTSTMFAVQWGLATDAITPADYDGDGRTDVAVWRASEARFYIRRTSDGGLTVINWGLSTDYPVPAAFVH